MSNITGIAGYPLYRGRVKVGLALSMPAYNDNLTWARQVRADNPGCYLLLRCDDGNDSGQYDRAKPAADEARRFYTRFIAPKLAGLPAGTVNAITGPCENWPDASDKAGLDFRAAFELALCGIVQDELRLDYVALNVPVGNLEPADLWRFAAVIRKAAWTAYHAYAKPGRTILEDASEPWWAWRATRLWLPELKRLGLPARFLFTECGPSLTPKATGFLLPDGTTDRAGQAALCLSIATALAKDCAERGAECGGTLPFGFGAEGTMGVDWNLDGQEAVFTAAAPALPPPPLPPEQPSGDDAGQAMTLQQQYPAEYAAWVAAGGVVNNYRAHLLGTGVLTPTQADVLFLIGEARARLNQIEGAVKAVLA